MPVSKGNLVDGTYMHAFRLKGAFIVPRGPRDSDRSSDSCGAVDRLLRALRAQTVAAKLKMRACRMWYDSVRCINWHEVFFIPQSRSVVVAALRYSSTVGFTLCRQGCSLKPPRGMMMMIGRATSVEGCTAMPDCVRGTNVAEAYVLGFQTRVVGTSTPPCTMWA